MAVLMVYVLLAWVSLFSGSPLFRGVTGITGLAFVALYLLLYRVRFWLPLVLVCALLAVGIVQPASALVSAVFLWLPWHHHFVWLFLSATSILG